MKTYTQLLNEIGLDTAARAIGARSARTQANPSEWGIKQMSRNLDHVMKKADKLGVDIMGKRVQGQTEKGYRDEMKKTPKIRMKTAREQGRGGEDSKLMNRIADYEKKRFSESTLHEISPLIEELVEAAPSKSSSAKSSSAGSGGQGRDQVSPLATRVGDALQNTLSHYARFPMPGPVGNALRQVGQNFQTTADVQLAGSMNPLQKLKRLWATRHERRAKREAENKANADHVIRHRMRKSKAAIDAKNAALSATTNIVTGDDGAIRRVAKTTTTSAPRRIAMAFPRRGGISPPQP